MLEINLKNTITINVDGTFAQVPKGSNVIEAMRSVGKEKAIPHYCYHPKLSVVGNCRMCLVEIGNPMRDKNSGEPLNNNDGSPKIAWVPKPVIGCSTIVADGMHIRTDSKNVKECRNGVTEFLLINHPLDCPICDQAGECKLQEYSAEHGRGFSRFKEDKNVKPKRTRLGPRVTLDDERCILCSRCIRFSQEIVNDDVLGFVDRGTYSTLTCYPGKELANNYSLNTVDICPVGALTSTDFRFKMRVWFLKRTKSICTESSVGSNTEIWSREGKIYRITPRRNDKVNDTWMTDSGRNLFKFYESKERLNSYLLHQKSANLNDLIIACRDILKSGPIGVIGSAFSSIEEQYLIKQLIEHLKGDYEMINHVGEGDGLLLSEDRTPNLRGSLINRLITKVPNDLLGALKDKINQRKIKTLIVFNEDIETLGIDINKINESINIIYFGSTYNSTAKLANVIFPSLSVYEKEGTFINQNFYLQKFNQAIPAPIGLFAERFILGHLLSILEVPGFTDARITMEDLWNKISLSIKELNKVKWSNIPDSGCLIDSSAWKHCKFIETKNLKYNPENK